MEEVSDGRSSPFCPNWGGVGCEVCLNLELIGTSDTLKGRGVYRSYYKGHKDKIKGEGRGGGGRWDWLGWSGGMGINADNCN